MIFLAQRGYRCIATETLDLKNAIHVGHSRVAVKSREYGSKRVAKAVLIGAIPPLTLKTASNLNGTPRSLATNHESAALFKDACR